MRERLIGLAAMAAAPAAVFGSGADNGSVNICEPMAHQIFLGENPSTSGELHLSDLPDDTKVVVTLGAIALIAMATNNVLRKRDYGTDLQKNSDVAAALAIGAAGTAVIAATWIPF